MLKPLSKVRIRVALAIAVTVDLFQIIGLAMSPFSVPLLLLNFPLGLITGLTMIALIGPHWILLPTLLAEAIPGLDVAPIWTLGVILATRRRSELAGNAPVRTPTEEEEEEPSSKKATITVDWFTVTFDQETVYLSATPPGREPWSQSFQWADVIRVCFEFNDFTHPSDAIYVFTSSRPESYVIPTGGMGGSAFFGELTKRGLIHADDFIEAQKSGVPFVCWPSNVPDQRT